MPQGVRAGIWKNGGYIPNFVAGRDSFLAMFYILENEYFIYSSEVP
jgi:hypothetical protein